MCVCVCACVRACVCVTTCRGIFSVKKGVGGLKCIRTIELELKLRTIEMNISRPQAVSLLERFVILCPYLGPQRPLL